MASSVRNTLYPLVLLLTLLASSGPSWAQTASHPASDPPKSAENAEFTAAADEVLKQMSDITGLKLRTPLKKNSALPRGDSRLCHT